MGERKGTNKYYPPDFDPKKHGSLAGYHGEHPLRERARKLHKGILIIRFEMPYNIWCDGCKIHIAMGVRYNAEKSKIGMYYTTPIYKFRMKCHLCDQHFEIKTDPANHDYVIISGARRKEQRWDPQANEQIVPEERGTQKRLAEDAMFRLEHGADDRSKVAKVQPTLARIAAKQERLHDDFAMNQLVRSQFRSEKTVLQVSAAEESDLLKKSSLDINLVKEKDSDKKLAKLMKYASSESHDDKQKKMREDIQISSIFQPTTSKTSSSKSQQCKSGSRGSSASSRSMSRLLRTEKKKVSAKNSLVSALSRSKAASVNVFGSKTPVISVKGLAAKGLVKKPAVNSVSEAQGTIVTLPLEKEQSAGAASTVGILSKPRTEGHAELSVQGSNGLVGSYDDSVDLVEACTSCEKVATDHRAVESRVEEPPTDLKLVETRVEEPATDLKLVETSVDVKAATCWNLMPGLVGDYDSSSSDQDS